MNFRYYFTTFIFIASPPVLCQSFWDAETELVTDNNWNRAAHDAFKHKDSIYKLAISYGISQELKGLNGMIYKFTLGHNKWQDFPSLSNTRFGLSANYQQRLNTSVSSPWFWLGTQVDHLRFNDKKRQANHYDVNIGLAQKPSEKWGYQLSLGLKKATADQETFNTKASYFNSRIFYKPTTQVSIGIAAGLETGDVVS